MSLIKIFFAFSVFASIANAQLIGMFGNNNYGGFEHTTKITTSCETLPQRYWHRVASIKNDKCVLLYSLAGCIGEMFRLEAGQHADLPNFYNTDSFRSCDNITDLSPFKDLRTQFYNEINYGNILIDKPISSRCQNLPDWASNQTYSIKTDVCVILYSGPDCSGTSFRVEKGNYGSLPDFAYATDSYKPCDPSEVLKKYTLTVILQHFDVVEGSNGSPEENDLEMGPTQFFQNNRSFPVIRRYSVTKYETEIVDMTRVVGTPDFHRFYFHHRASSNFSEGIPVIAQDMVSSSLKVGYLFQRNTGDVGDFISTEYQHSVINSFQVAQYVQVPSCTTYEISSKLKMITNYPIDYTGYAEVNGECMGYRLNTEEIRGRLPSDMIYVGDKNAYTLEVKLSGSLKANFGLSKETNIVAHPIEGCISKAEDSNNV